MQNKQQSEINFKIQNASKIKRCFAILCMLCVMALIFYFSGQSGVESSKISEGVAKSLNIEKTSPYVAASAKPLWGGFSLRKYAHILLYLALGISAYFSFEASTKNGHHWKIQVRQIAIALVICLLYSLSDEWHQSFIPGRKACLTDCGIDAIGYSIGIVIAILAQQLINKLFQKKNKG